ncbi:unnamed protein product [Amaranthus hypochondriacus]
MGCHRRIKAQNSKAFRRSLHILRDLIHSNSDKTSSIIMDAFLFISALELKLEALKRQSMLNHVKHIDHQCPILEVKVEKHGENQFRINVRSEKGKDNLVNVLEAFEKMGIIVISAKVSCVSEFGMEAIVEVNNANEAMDSSVLTNAILKAIETI